MEIKPPSRGSKTSSRPSTRKVGSRYSKVKPTIDSGKTIRKVEVLSNRVASKLKGELFLRITSEALSELIINSTQNEGYNNSYKSQDFFSFSPTHKNAKPVSVRPVIFSMTNPQILSITEQSEFIVLDLREDLEYAEAHIKTAVSFPAINISRGKFHPHLLQMKNQEGKHIIVYSYDEKTGVEVAQQLCQRNYCNVYLLTGGFIEFCKWNSSLIDVRS